MLSIRSKERKETKKQKNETKDKIRRVQGTKKQNPPKNKKETQKRKFWGGVQKLPFLTTWPRKRAHQKTL